MTELLSAADVANQAGVSISTISREVSRGRLKAAWQAPGPNGIRLFHPRDVKRWMKYRHKASA